MKANQKIKVTVVAATLMVAHVAAMAWKNSFDPNAVTAVADPNTNVITNAWKLTGAKGTLIAPHWFISAFHVRNKAGQVYSNSFGTAVIESCQAPSYATYDPVTDSSQPDFHLCKLQSPITPPNGFVFPPIVEDPNGLVTAARPVDRVAPQMGSFLATGFGLPNAGQQRAVWLDFMHIPVTYSPELAPNVPAVPYVGSGDSGSAVFWLPPGKTEASLVATTTGDAVLRGQLFFDAKLLNWISSTVASNSTDNIRTIPLSQYFTIAKASPPRLDADSLKASSTASGATITWKRPASASGTDISMYGILLGSKGENIRSIGVKENTTGTFTYTFNNLASTTDFTACVVPMNGAGVSQLGEIQRATITLDPTTGTTIQSYLAPRQCASIYTSPMPDRVASVTTVAETTTVAKVVYPSFKVTWPAVTTPTGVRIQKYRVRITEDGVLGFNDYVNGTQTVFHGWAFTTPGPKRICAIITPVAYTNNFGDPGVPYCSIVTQ